MPFLSSAICSSFDFLKASNDVPCCSIRDFVVSKLGEYVVGNAFYQLVKSEDVQPQKNVAILNDKTTYGKGLADETKKSLNKAGFTEKMFESYNKGDKDFNSIVSRLKRDKRLWASALARSCTSK